MWFSLSSFFLEALHWTNQGCHENSGAPGVVWWLTFAPRCRKPVHWSTWIITFVSYRWGGRSLCQVSWLKKNPGVPYFLWNTGCLRTGSWNNGWWNNHHIHNWVVFHPQQKTLNNQFFLPLLRWAGWKCQGYPWFVRGISWEMQNPNPLILGL